MVKEEPQQISISPIHKFTFEKSWELSSKPFNKETIQQYLTICKESDFSVLLIIMKILINQLKKYKSLLQTKLNTQQIRKLDNLLFYINKSFKQIKYAKKTSYRDLEQLNKLAQNYVKVRRIDDCVEEEDFIIKQNSFQMGKYYDKVKRECEVEKEIKNNGLKVIIASEDSQKKFVKKVQKNTDAEDLAGHQTTSEKIIPKLEIGLPTQKQKNSTPYHSYFPLWQEIQSKIDHFYSTSTTPQTQSLQKCSNKQCLQCLKRIYAQQPLNYPPSKQKVSYFSDLKLAKNYASQLAEEVMSYLNSQTGGIIFLGCKVNHCKILPLVQEINQRKKTQIQAKIKEYFDKIYPKITNGKHYELTWVPIAQEHQNGKKLKYIQGAFIMRIAIRSLQPQKTYHFNYNSKSFFQFRTPQNKIITYQNQQIYQKMQQRFIKYTRLSKIPRLRQGYNYIPSLSYHLHDESCVKPDIGSLKYGPKQPDKIPTDIKEKPNQFTMDKFKTCTLLVMDKGVKEKVQQCFRAQKFDLQIIASFPQEHYKLSKNTFIIKHKTKFQKLKGAILKEENVRVLRQKNNGKSLYLISTLPTILIERSQDFTREVQSNLQFRVSKKMGQKMQFKKIGQEIFIKCSNYMTAIFVYFQLKNQNINNKFEKIPTGTNQKFPKKNIKKQPRKIPSKKINQQQNQYFEQQPTNEQVDYSSQESYLIYEKELFEYYMNFKKTYPYYSAMTFEEYKIWVQQQQVYNQMLHEGYQGQSTKKYNPHYQG